MKILVINGANLNMTGIREISIYGTKTLSEAENELISYGKANSCEVACFQSNSEGEIINRLHQARDTYDGVIINAGAYSHYSYAIRDAITACELPVIEVHISNVYKREEFRHTSVIAPVCTGYIAGLGMFGYKAALTFFIDKENENQ